MIAGFYFGADSRSPYLAATQPATLGSETGARFDGTVPADPAIKQIPASRAVA